MDFTINKYREICLAIKKSKYASITIANYLKLDNAAKNRPHIIMRHDIDRDPVRALDVAQTENENGICATYYFRTQKKVYNPDIIDKVESFKHEIGYHYETLDKNHGDMELAKAMFARELTDFRKKYEISTVCAHGNPLTRWDNKDIWKSQNFNDFKLLGEAFLSLDYNQFAYFSDSGRTWLNNKSQKMPGKDFVYSSFNHIATRSSDDIIRIILEGKIPNICILTHPERWSKSYVSFTRRYFVDLAFSWGKTVIYAYRKRIGVA